MNYLYSMFRELVHSNVYVFLFKNLYDTQVNPVILLSWHLESQDFHCYCSQACLLTSIMSHNLVFVGWKCYNINSLIFILKFRMCMWYHAYSTCMFTCLDNNCVFSTLSFFSFLLHPRLSVFYVYWKKFSTSILCLVDELNSASLCIGNLTF